MIAKNDHQVDGGLSCWVVLRNMESCLCQISDKCDIDFITELRLVCCQVFSFDMAMSRAIILEVVALIFIPCQICRIWIAIDISNGCTTTECIRPDIRNAVWYCHNSKSAAILECTDTDVLHTIANYQICQICATTERGSPNIRHAVRYRHARKVAAILERLDPDARHAVWYRHARKPATAGERGIPDARDMASNRYFCYV